MAPTTLRALNKIVRRGKKQNLSPTRTLVSFYTLKQKKWLHLCHAKLYNNITMKKPKKHFKNKWYETVIHKKAGIIALKYQHWFVCGFLPCGWDFLKCRMKIGCTELRLEWKTELEFRRESLQQSNLSNTVWTQSTQKGTVCVSAESCCISFMELTLNNKKITAEATVCHFVSQTKAQVVWVLALQ